MIKIAIASDHAGYKLKKHIIESKIVDKISTEYVLLDLGTDSADTKVDYTDFAKLVCNEIIDGNCNKAILICGSGIGMSIAANRYKGIYAALCVDNYMAEMSRKHNNSNILVLGAKLIKPEDIFSIIKIFLETDFEYGRHTKRIEKIDYM